MAYTFLTADLRTGGGLMEVPELDVTDATRQVNGAGDCNGSIFLGGVPKARLGDVLAAVEPYRRKLFLDRDGTIVWSGFIRRSRYDESSQTLTLLASEMEAYWARRVNSKTRTYMQVDQLAIITGILTAITADPGGDVQILLPAGATSGVLRDRTYPGNELKPVLEILDQLAAVEGGFDYDVVASWEPNGTIATRLHLGYPRLGRPVTQTGLVFTYPGNITGFSFEVDGDRAASTRQWAIGSGEGTEQLLATITETAAIDAGYPLTENVSSYTDVTVKSTLDAHAREDLRAARVPGVLDLTVRADLDPVLGSYIPGDDVRAIIDSPRFPAGLDLSFRLGGYRITPPGESRAESVQLSIAEAVA